MADLLGIEIALLLGAGLLVFAIVGGGITYEVVKHKEEIEGVINEVEEEVGPIVEDAIITGRFIMSGGEILYENTKQLYKNEINAVEFVAENVIETGEFTHHLWLASQDQEDPGYEFKLEKRLAEKTWVDEYKEWIGFYDSEWEDQLREKRKMDLAQAMKENEERVARAVENRRREEELAAKRQANAEEYERRMVEEGVFDGRDRRVQGIS